MTSVRLSRTGIEWEKIIPWAVLGLLLFYTLAQFWWAPYDGFFRQTSGLISSVYADIPLRPGDVLVQVGDLTWDSFQNRLRIKLFGEAQPGQPVQVIVRRDAALITLNYLYPQPTVAEFNQRFFNMWPLPYVFWFVGTVVMLMARPKHRTWQVLIAFNYLTALWISQGGLSAWRFADAAIWLRVFIWLSIAVYIDLHCLFPSPFRRLPGWVIGAVYAICLVLAVAQWFELLAPGLAFVAFAVALMACFGLLVLHYIYQADQRSTIVIVMRAFGLAAVPVVGLTILGLIVGNLSLAGGLLFLPIIPMAYGYAVFRYQLGGLEAQANRLIATYLFVALVMMLTLTCYGLIQNFMDGPEDWWLVGLRTSAAVVLVTRTGYDPFQTFVERYLLRVPPLPKQILDSYAAKIVGSLNLNDLSFFLRDQIADKLLVQQSLLARLDNERPRLLYSVGLDNSDLPAEILNKKITAPFVAHRSEAENEFEHWPTWITVVLPLAMEQSILGYWILGQRAPDNIYSAEDIRVLTAIANQTAVAMHNIIQTERLHGLYQKDIDEREAERANLARELHDHVLNELGLVWRQASAGSAEHDLNESYRRLTDNLRHTITGLRPAAVDFGLRLALADLVDRASMANPQVVIRLAIPDQVEGMPRYKPEVELHIYRIVRQCLANALHYAQAQTITIKASLLEDSMEIVVVDDGLGFAIGQNLDVAQLVAHQHFGLANMLERAQLIGAEIKFHSAPSQGTSIQIRWVVHPLPSAQ
jgi:signal transduction histidine kinase